jgi:hypothetical protein
MHKKELDENKYFLRGRERSRDRVREKTRERERPLGKAKLVLKKRTCA